VALVRTDFSEEGIASIRVTGISELGMLATSNCHENQMDRIVREAIEIKLHLYTINRGWFLSQ
jgi:hypothetical protein